MQREWMKASATYTLVGKGHEKGAKHTFGSVAKEVDAGTIAEFGKILEVLTSDKFTAATIASTDIVGAE